MVEQEMVLFVNGCVNEGYEVLLGAYKLVESGD